MICLTHNRSVSCLFEAAAFALLLVTAAPTIATPQGCFKPTPWKAGVDSQDRDYINETNGRTLLEFDGPGNEDEHGAVPAGSTVFAATFNGLFPGRKYVLSTSLDNERSDQPYIMSFTGLQGEHPEAKLSVPSGKTQIFRLPMTAIMRTATVFWQVKGHNKMWAFSSGLALCPVSAH